jgi:hypothetical protein
MTEHNAMTQLLVILMAVNNVYMLKKAALKEINLPSL